MKRYTELRSLRQISENRRNYLKNKLEKEKKKLYDMIDENKDTDQQNKLCIQLHYDFIKEDNNFFRLDECLQQLEVETVT